MEYDASERTSRVLTLVPKINCTLPQISFRLEPELAHYGDAFAMSAESKRCMDDRSVVRRST